MEEIWLAPSPAEAVALLARCMGMPEDYDEDLRTEIWVELVFKLLDFCRTSKLTTTKALAFLGVMTALHAHAVETKCGQQEAFGVMTDGLLAATQDRTC